MQRHLALLFGVIGLLIAVCAGAAPPPGELTVPPRRIALLLPINSPLFGPAATMVKNGFMASYQGRSAAETAIAVTLFPTGDEADEILAVYRQALQAGATTVVGPLTRSAVAAIADSGAVNVPTLALNAPDRDVALPPRLFLFGLTVESEARQVAKLAWSDGRRRAALLETGSPLAKRMQQAFQDQWRALGGEVKLTLSVDGDYAGLRQRLESSGADFLFLAAEADKARMLRPYLSNQLPTYATSQVHGGRDEPEKNVDLNGVRFVDMPWLLQPDHTAVMVYPRPDRSTGIELERFYALGIDAYRLAAQLPGSPSLDGVTGGIRLEGQQFQRELVPAQFSHGMAVPLDSVAP